MSQNSNAMTKVAIVIPVFKHSGLLPETITSALSQQTDLSVSIVLVNDGCPFPETDIVCRQYAISNPKKVYYIHKPNGGLSSARNAGIGFALSVFPELEAIYLMDADNRISPTLIQNSYSLLMSSPPDVGWAYPDIDKFGIEEFCDISGDYNVFEHILWNFCEAGSMVRREVFDAGLRYDENMRLGYEDWEFWLQCIEAGFRGVHVPYSGFKYRQRGESMLKDSERHHEEIMSYIKKKHNKLMGMNQFFTYEDEYAPRFAFYFSDTHKFYFVSDLTNQGRTVSYADFKDAFLRCSIKAEIGKCPPYLVVTTSRLFSLFASLKILPGLIWKMQIDLDSANFAQLAFRIQQDRSMNIELVENAEPDTNPALLMCKMQLLQAAVNDKNRDWLMSITTANPQPNIAYSSLKASANFAPPRTINARELFIALYHELRNDKQAVYYEFFKKTSTQYFRESMSLPENYTSRLFHLRHTLPLKRLEGGLNIAIVLPLAEFGGVEKVAFNYAEVLRQQGHKLHLVIVGRNRAHIPSSFEGTFSSVTFFNDAALGQYSPSGSNHDYLGSALPTWNENGRVDDAIGLLAAMNVVINFNVIEFHGLSAALRKLGVKSYSSQHLIDLSPFEQPQGTPHQFLAYEHAYDGVLVISRQLYSWFVAHGVPSAKLMYIPNAASYPLEEKKRSRLLRERKNRATDKLNVLYIGRFDRQKGLDRLAAVVTQTQLRNMPIEWRIVGKSILGDDDGSMSALEPYLHPPAMTPDELSKHFGWADVMIMVSRFEGVPLTILEAGRLGCVILATNVGAVEEILEHGRTGYLFESEQDDALLVRQVCDKLDVLCSDRSLLNDLSDRSSEYYGSITWHGAMAPLLEEIGAMVRGGK